MDDDGDIIKNKIDTIMGQTDYCAEEAHRLLVAANGDEIAVIRAYLGLAATCVNDSHKSTNQLIYQEIRKFMDGCKEISTPAIPAISPTNTIDQ